MEDKKTKQQLFEHAQKLMEKLLDLKLTITEMLDEMDKIQIEYNNTVEEIKKS